MQHVIHAHGLTKSYGEVVGRFADDQSPRYYNIKTDLPAAEARAYARHLDRMYEEFSRRLASLPPRAPEKLSVPMKPGSAV